ncbi:MAG: hypothetical protein KA004_10830, partial [Verrucomicrobiales bacterium]|nr:hypothetical protein [Verrucomicrobiales bacterium]
PQEKELPKTLQEQNEKLRDSFQIEGYPTIVLADAAGKPYAKTGYQEGGPTEYLKHLAELRAVREKRDAAFALAAKADGLEKAKHLAAGLDALGEDIVGTHYATTVDEIIALDNDDALGLKKKHESQRALRKLEEKLQALHGEGKFDDYAKAIDAFIDEHKLAGEQKQRVMMMKMPLFDETKLDAAEKLLGEVIKLDDKSETAQQAREIIEQINDIRTQQKEDEKNKDGKPAETEKEAGKAEKQP